jgi:hypothetical protein
MDQRLQFQKWPWLLFERQVIEVTGYGHNTIEKLIDCGTLLSVKPRGCTQRRFQKIQVAQLLAVELDQQLESFRREPLLLSEKSVLSYSGFSRTVLREVTHAGGLQLIRPAGLSTGRYRKSELAQLLGLAVVL